VFSKAVAPIWPSVNPQTGPIYVQGAEPGDTLVLKIMSIEPDRKEGCSSLLADFGFLSQTRVTAMLHDPQPEITWMYPINKGKGTVTFVSRLGLKNTRRKSPCTPSWEPSDRTGRW